MGTKTKSDNRRALPKYILTIVIAAFFGALAGFGAGIVGTGNLSKGVKTAVNAALTAAAPWGIPVTSVVFLGLGWRLYANARRLYNTWDGEAEEPVDTAEETLSWALLMSAIALLWDFFFLSVLVICGAGSSLERLGGVTLFLVSVAVIVVLQQKVVDLTRRINPEKQGSVYDLKFQKKWMDSCDEAERAQIGQACYRAYMVGTKVCIFLWVALLILNFVFDFGLLPIAAVLAVWGAMQTVYALECIRLSKRTGDA